MSLKRREYKVDDRAKKAAVFFRACEANPDTRLSIPAVMRAKGYSIRRTKSKRCGLLRRSRSHILVSAKRLSPPPPLTERSSS
jgi:hypothetical protein